MSPYPNPKRRTLFLSHFTGTESSQDSISSSLAPNSDPVLPQMVSPYLASGTSPVSPYLDTKKTEPFVKRCPVARRLGRWLPVPVGVGVSGCCPRPLPDVTSQHSQHLPLLGHNDPSPLPQLLFFLALLPPFPLLRHRAQDSRKRILASPTFRLESVHPARLHCHYCIQVTAISSSGDSHSP